MKGWNARLPPLQHALIRGVVGGVDTETGDGAVSEEAMYNYGFFGPAIHAGPQGNRLS